MSQVAFSNAVTDLFGTRLPIVAGGLMWLGDADYVAAASRAGIIGFITAASFPEPQALRSEIRRCRELCEGGPFGVLDGRSGRRRADGHLRVLRWHDGDDVGADHQGRAAAVRRDLHGHHCARAFRLQPRSDRTTSSMSKALRSRAGIRSVQRAPC